MTSAAHAVTSSGEFRNILRYAAGSILQSNQFPAEATRETEIISICLLATTGEVWVPCIAARKV